MPGKHKLVWNRCGWCGKLMQVRKHDLTRGRGRFCSKAHASWWFHYMSGIPKRDTYGSNNPAWRGGETYHTKGYIYQYAPDHPAASNGYVLQHRLVAEEKLGRYLLLEEVVHHKDGNKVNNHPDNIEVFEDQRNHTLHHHQLRYAAN